MKHSDELDRKFMAWLDDPFTPPAPAYLGEVLDRTRRTRQRRSWASLERWLPMTITLRRPMLAPPMRLLAIGLASILVLAAAMAAVPVLSRLGLFPAAVAAPWHNGLIAFSRNGNIYVVDPTGGDPRVLIAGTSNDGPDWSPDGTKIAFWGPVGLAQGLMVADADGSNVRRLTNEPVINGTGYWWSPDGSQLLMTSTVDTKPAVSIVAADGSGTQALDLGVPITDAYWYRDGKSLLVRALTPDGTTLYSASLPDGTLSEPIVRSDTTSAFYATDRGVNDLLWPQLSPDGSMIAYTQGQAPPDGKTGVFGGMYSRNHVVGADGTGDRMVEYAADSDYEDGAQWSPDGSRLLMIIRKGDFHQAAIATIGGSQPIIATAPMRDPSALWSGWSPDGTTILTVRDADGVAAMVDAATGATTPLSWLGGPFDWQPVKP